MPKNKDLLTITSAAAMLGVSPATLRKWGDEGKIKAIRLGNRGDRRYRREDLLQFLQQGEGAGKPVDEVSFQKWLERGNFWMEEANFLFMLGELPGKRMGQLGHLVSPAFQFCLFTFENGYMHQILSVDESIAMSRAYIETWQKNPEKIETIFNDWQQREKILEKIMDRLDFVDIRHLSNGKLLEEFNTFTEATDKYWEVSLILEPYQPYIDTVLLPHFLQTVSHAKHSKEAFAALCSPAQSSFIAEERKDLLRMAVKYLHSPEKRKQLQQQSPEDFLADIKRNDPAFFQSMQQHQQHYYWMQNSYSEWMILSLNHFIQFLRDTVKELNATEMKAELEKMENTQRLEAQQQHYIRELKVPAGLVNELKFIQRITWMKDDRKRVILMMNHHFFRFVHEFARRTNQDYKLIGNAFVSEVPAILNQSFPLEQLQKRRESSVFVVQEGNRHSLLTGNQSLAVIEKVLSKKEMHHAVEEIHGIVASRGNDSIVSGKVKVILDPKNQNISEDEILVASMTRPEFLPLMKKAKAFITNEGGITCHAAIVSREMNKPCIIGTLHATKALKDGDEVEMLMNHGVIRINKSPKQGTIKSQ